MEPERAEELESLEHQAGRLLAAVRDRDASSAARLLERRPGLARADLFTACCAGDADFVAAALAADPRLAVTRHEPDGWTPLLYLCSSPLLADLPERARGSLRCAELLLDRGADPNSYAVWGEGPDGGEARLPALYFACVSGNAPVVRLLLERGADPNDGESVYHAAELNRRECLELLLAHGADISGRHPQWRNTPLYFLAGYKEIDPSCATATEGMRWLLEHGADPNVTSCPMDETPLHRVAAFGRPAAVETLLAHGAEVDKPRADGRTAYALAVRSGNAAVADLLLRSGADPGKAAPLDELLGACLRADAGAARALLARHPDLPSGPTPEDRQALLLAVEEGREESVRLIAELGFGLDWEGPWGGTPLHHAAWRGNAAMVRLLLELGAPVNVRDSQFGSAPLGWAGHGSAHCRQADDDYLAVVEALLAAGSDRETSINRWGRPPEEMASPRVAERLRTL